MPPRTNDVRKQLEREGRVRTRLPVYQRRVERAKSIIRNTVPERRAVMVSGGKDSVVLAHLTRMVDRESNDQTPMFFVNCGAETPWTIEVINDLYDRGWPVWIVDTEPSLPKMLKQVGWQGYDGPDREDGDWHWKSQQIRRVLVDEPAERICEGTGRDIHLLGLRSAESPGRAKNRQSRGAIYQKNGMTIVTPIVDWESADVFAYLTTNELPISPVYLQPHDDEHQRGRRRTSAAHLTHGVAWNHAWHYLRIEQPQFWQEITQDFPEMRRQA